MSTLHHLWRCSFFRFKYFFSISTGQCLTFISPIGRIITFIVYYIIQISKLQLTQFLNATCLRVAGGNARSASVADFLLAMEQWSGDYLALAVEAYIPSGFSLSLAHRRFNNRFGIRRLRDGPSIKLISYGQQDSELQDQQ